MNFSAESFGQLVSYWVLKAIVAAAIFYVGRMIARWVADLVGHNMLKHDIDEMLSRLTKNVVYIGLLALVVLAAVSQLGVDTTSALALFGAAGLAVGLALKDSLSNFAAGVMIVFFQPFKLGHYVEAAGTSGTVILVEMFNTTLLTPDNKRVVVPNSLINNEVIVNYSAEDTRRLDLVFGIAYDDDIRKVKQLIESILNDEGRILDEPEPVIAVGELADSSVNINVRPWVKSEDYWGVRGDLLERIKIAFDDHGISIPFPQHEVHLQETDKQAA